MTGRECRFASDPDGSVDERATSHNGYNSTAGKGKGWASDAGIEPIKAAEEAIGLRDGNGWGPETRLLIVSGGSHAGNTAGIPDFERITLGRDIHLIPLEPIAAGTEAALRDQSALATSAPGAIPRRRAPD